MNNTKWNELKDSMYHLRPNHPQWRTRSAENGYESDWDGDWFYHFQLNGYESIEWVDIKVNCDAQRKAVLAALKEINLPGEETVYGFRIYGYIKEGQLVGYVQ